MCTFDWRVEGRALTYAWRTVVGREIQFAVLAGEGQIFETKGQLYR